METGIKSFDIAQLECLTCDHLAEFHQILVDEDWDASIEELSLIHHEYAKYMTVALNEHGQILGEKTFYVFSLTLKM